MRSGTSSAKTAVVVCLLACAGALLLGYIDKARCAGAPFDAAGRSMLFDQRKHSEVCYSDVQFLWAERGLDQHVVPYVHGAITTAGILVGGTVEYPVLTGVLMWVAAAPADNDAQFLLFSALLLAPFALVTAWLLIRLAGRAAYLWATGPPLVLYAFHNWELPVVATTVAAVYVVVATDRLPLRRRAVVAAVLLGVGTCLKLYPAAFVLPLMAFVLTGGVGGRELPVTTRGRLDVRGAVTTGVAALTTIVAVNLPFAIAGYDGWRASFVFQQIRQADITTNSIWFWGLRPLVGDGFDIGPTYNALVELLSPTAVLAAFALALWLGWRAYTESGTFPWIGVSAAMLCGFLLFHKAFSPQYTLWLIPFLVLVRIPWGAVAAYLVADVIVGIGVFRFYNAIETGAEFHGLMWLVIVGVWARAVLVGYFYFAFLRRPLRSGTAPPPQFTARPDDDVEYAVGAR